MLSGTLLRTNIKVDLWIEALIGWVGVSVIRATEKPCRLE